MTKFLFDEFNKTSAAAWKQKIQVDLNGDDYNENLLWKTNDGIVVKPFYTKEDRTNHEIKTTQQEFNICQRIFVDDEKIANSLAIDALKRGANSIQFTANSTFNYVILLQNINLKNTVLYFNLNFLDAPFQIKLSQYINANNTYFQTDIIGHLAESGNWFSNLKNDFSLLTTIVEKTQNCISVSLDLYQNAGATITQQLAYTLAHANEYLNYFGKEAASKIHFNFAIGSNYFFEIAKLNAFKLLWSSLLNEYSLTNSKVHIFATPTLRNKTLQDYNVNMLRTTTECMSAIFGGANTISNVSYDVFFQKSNEFGERISRNQLLILKEECQFTTPQNYVKGTYYIETITHQLAENALTLFKEIENSGGFLKQLKAGKIQEKIKQNALKEALQFKEKTLILVGTNYQENKKEQKPKEFELYPFTKDRKVKTLIRPILKSRIAESIEKEILTSKRQET